MEQDLFIVEIVIEKEDQEDIKKIIRQMILAEPFFISVVFQPKEDIPSKITSPRVIKKEIDYSRLISTFIP